MSTTGTKADDALSSTLNLHSQTPIQIKLQSAQSLGGNGTAIVVNKRAGQQNGPVRRLVGHSYGLSDSVSSPAEKTVSSNNPIAINLRRNIVVVHMRSNQKSTSYRFFANVFTILQSQGVSVDLVSTSEVQISVAINASSLRSEARFNDAVAELTGLGEVTVHTDKAILSLSVGQNLNNRTAGIAGQMFATLGEQGVSIEMISYQAGEANISCVIPAKHATYVISQLDTELLIPE